ncbi:MAG TPA: penicillin-binding transpeptidase domain-containing protein [Thermoanaerobaculia bacterium]|jgi:peptidoglycan glycosyltransferase|nr:penicillin-binding transpeptidase domain-containing protein [Thermoanaerobaculia bacterium]
MKPRRMIAPLLVALVVLGGLLMLLAWFPLRRAREEWRGGRTAQAIADAERWSRLRLWPGQYQQLLAAAYLTSGNMAAARPHLDGLAKRKLWLSAVPKEEVARKLYARGDYAGFLAYDAASHELREAADVALYRAAAQTATNRIDEAEATLRSVDRGAVDGAKVGALEQAIAQRKQGSYPLVVDRDGRTIAAYQLGNQELVAIDRTFEALIDKRAGQLTFGAQLGRLRLNDTIETTLDPAVQKAAMQALGGFRGSIVAIDPRTNEILAIASNAQNGPLLNLALERQYEPGSVIKVLTGLNAVSSGMDLQPLFPYQCKGELMIDGRHFGDWLPAGHGTLPTLDDALAQSCNVLFADLGVRLGMQRLRAFMTSAGFDGQADLGVFQVPLGRTVGPIFNNFETAFYAIGLEHESINALHLAMIGSLMANRGELVQPRLLRGRRSLLGESSAVATPQTRTRLARPEAGETMVRAMVAVSSDPKGTGRRAQIPGLTIAMKTGTAGERTPGSNLESLIVAFAPAEKPAIAFGMIAEDAGPAEYAGAKIAHDFLEAVKGRP